MSRLSLEQLVTTPSSLNYLSESAYDFTKWNLGKGLIYNAGVTAVDKYIAPQFNVIRPMEESTPFAISYTYAVNFSPTIDYLFGVENSVGATATRRVALWTVNKKTGAVSWNGFITMTLATATAHTVRDFKIDRKQYSAGTASASGTAVTGAGTAWNTSGIAVGARIGFGSTDPKAITTWYRVSAVGGAGAITLATSAGTVGSGAYVIEEYRPVYLATNATTTNGGIHYGKGISIEDFTSGGTTIALATTVDNAKAMYWLKDNITTQTNIVGAGMAIDFETATDTSLTAYVTDLVSAGNYKFYTYNLRASLTVASGASGNAWLIATGNNPFTGTGTQNANTAIATAGHGTGSGVKSLYIVTTTRIYRVPLTQITTTSTTVFSAPSDNIAEIPAGGASTFAITSAFSTIEYMSDIDAFVIGTTHATANFSYVSQYVASGQQLQNIWGRDYRYTEQSLKDSNHPSIFSNQSTVFAFQDSGAGSNIMYGVKQGTAITTNHIYVLPFGADWNYAVNTSGRLISPRMTTTNALKFYRAFINTVRYLGSTTLGKTTEPLRMYARTANITTDATTGWVLMDETNDLSGFAGASNIQFAVEFKTIGESCLPARVLGVNLSYEDNTTDSHYAVSVAKSDITNKRFAFWFKTAFGATVPTLTIRLYDADTGGLLLTDVTNAPTLGTFEKTTDGTTWTAYNTTDRANATTWIRYTPTSLADNIKVQAYLTQG